MAVADSLSVQVLFKAVDRLTGPLKGMSGGSKGLKADIAATRKEIVALERAQGRAGAFRKAENDYRRLGSELKVARLEAKAAKLDLQAAEKPTAALARAAEKAAAAEAKLGAAYQAQGLKLQKLGSELENAGVDISRLIEHEDALDLKVYEANKRLEQQQKRLEGIAKWGERAAKVKAVGEKISRAGMAASLGITLPAAAFGKAAFDAAGDAVELQSAFDTTFGALSAKMNRWADETGNAMGRSTQEMQRGANTFGIFFNQVAKADKAAAMSQKFAVLAQDLGSFFNTDTETAIQKLRSGLSGEAEPLRDFGVFLNEAAVKAKLLEMKIKPVGKEFTDQQKILARYQLILEATKKAQGDVARTSDSSANRLRRSKAAFEELQVTVGQKLIPALTPLIVQVTALLERFNQLDPATQSTIVKAVAIAAALGPVLTIVGKLTSGIGFLLPFLARLGPLFLMIGSAALRAGAMMLANPVILAITLLVAAVAGAAYLIWRHWDKIKAAFNGAVAWLSGVWTRIKGAFVAGLVGFATLHVRFAQIGAQLIAGLISGIVGKLGALKNTIVNAAKSAANWFKQKLGIRSPSRVFMGFGGHITEGLSRGIAAGESAAVRRVDRLSSRVAGAFAAGSLVASPAFATSPITPIAPTAVGSPAARGSSSPGAAAAAAPAQLGPIEIHIHQLPGQSSDELARAVAEKLRELQAVGSRSSYHDD